MHPSDLPFSLTRDHLIGAGPLVLGIFVASALVLAVWFGRRRRAREPGPPDPRDQPPPPEHPMGYETERREPDEIRRNGTRHLPHDLPGHGTEGSRPSAAHGRPTWEEGGGTSHGTG